MCGVTRFNKASIHHACFLVRSAPISVISLCILSVLLATLSGFSLVITGTLLNEVVGISDSQRLRRTMFALLFCFALFPVLESACRGLTVIASDRYVKALTTRASEALLKPHTITFLLDPQTAQMAKSLKSTLTHWTLPRALPARWDIVRMRLSALPCLFLVAQWNAWIAILVTVCLIIAARFTDDFSRQIMKTMKDESHEALAADYYYGVATRKRQRNEVHLYALGGWLGDQVRHWGSLAANLSGKRIRLASRPAYLSAFVALGAYLIAMTKMCFAVIASPQEAGAFVTVILALVGLSGFGPVGDRGSIADAGRRTLDSIRALERRISTGSDLPLAEPVREISAGPKEPVLICDGLHYAYPGQQTEVLKGLSVTIHPGERVGLVGANGAGKTTLVRLILGMLEPDAGSVAILEPQGNGHAASPPVAWVPQRFLRLPASLTDNVYLGKKARDSQAIQHLAGLQSDSAATLEASGGQWQQVALARGVAAVEAGARLLILDEPTAALDPEAEHVILNETLAAVPDAAVLIISHRLSAVRQADRILVLEEGTIVEEGTHAELLALGGRYSRMFTAQSEPYG